jgi:hypothetical protein
MAEHNLFGKLAEQKACQFFGTPASFISSAKIKRLCAAMDHYIIQKELNVEV